MKSLIKKWLITNMISGLIWSTLFISLSFTANAEVTQPPTQIKITDASSALTEMSQKIHYCINTSGYVTVGIYKPKDAASSYRAAILTDNSYTQTGCYDVNWDQKYGSKNETGTTGALVEDGEYYYGINVTAVSPATGTDYIAGWLYVDQNNDGSYSNEKLKIEDVQVENSIFDPSNDQEAEISFIINKKANISLEIYDEDDYKIKTLLQDESYEKGEYSIDWDGEDMYGDTVSQGEYTYKLFAEAGNEKDKEDGAIIVKKGYEIDEDTIDPRLKTVFATKESFDPGMNEEVQIVFNLTAKADVKVEIYDKNGNKIEKLMDEDDLNDGIYSVEWDGEVVTNQEGVYTYRVYAQNSKGDEVSTGQIEVKKDDKNDKKPNVYKDKVDQIPYAPKNNELYFKFTVDRDSTISLEIRDEDNVLATVFEDYEMDEGPASLGWDGQDEYGQYIENGVYEYKIIAENEKGKDVEKGTFLITDSGNIGGFSGKCGSFADVSEDNTYCEAIKWTESENVFKGYPDGTFKPNQSITRAEALKVILEAMKVNLLSANGENLGFKDVNRFEWYMTYLKTALSLGIVNGYPDGSFRPNNPVNRVEGLVMILNTGKAKYNITIPTTNYGNPYYDTPNEAGTKWYISYVWFAKMNNLNNNDAYFYPDSSMTRGEMADMLYRYYEAGLDLK